MTSERIELYTKKMKEINFMAEYMSDIPEIFDTKTIKCKLFLAKIFTVLYPNFHYLSFLSEGEIDKELVKVASILHTYSNDPHQISELLSNINETKAHIFWIRLFNLCKIYSGYINSNSVFKESYNNKKLFHSKFSNINKTLQHMNYNIGTINATTEADINEEINTWTKKAPLVIAKVESSFNIVSPLEVKENNLPKINNLISVINYIEKKIDCKSEDHLKKNYVYEDFFVDFNQTVKEVSLFKKNLNFISSFIVPKIISTKTVYNGINWDLYKYQIKKCNKIIEDITFKAKNCNSSALNINF